MLITTAAAAAAEAVAVTITIKIYNITTTRVNNYYIQYCNLTKQILHFLVKLHF